MTGARAAVEGTFNESQQNEPLRDFRPRIATPASTIGPWLPEGALGEALAEGLAAVEAELVSSVGSEHAFIREAAGHLMAAGGKRFRPMLALLAAQLGDPTGPEVVRAAVVC
jgi:heptaprenyl diphosphate synthase